MSEMDVVTEEISSRLPNNNNILIIRPHLHPTVLFSGVSADSQGGISLLDPKNRSFSSSELVPTHSPSALGQPVDEASVVAKEPTVISPFFQDEIIKLPPTSGINQPPREVRREMKDNMMRAEITVKRNGNVEGDAGSESTMLKNGDQSMEVHDISSVSTCVAEEDEGCTSRGQVVVVLWSASNEEEDEEDLYTHPSFHSPQHTK